MVLLARGVVSESSLRRQESIGRSDLITGEIESNSTATRKDLLMTLKDKRNETLALNASPVQSHTEDTSANHAPNHDEVRRRAYEIYLERGGLPGQEFEDWFQAEREIESAAHFMRATIGEKHKP
jgi:hypothetical protein